MSIGHHTVYGILEMLDAYTPRKELICYPADARKALLFLTEIAAKNYIAKHFDLKNKYYWVVTIRG